METYTKRMNKCALSHSCNLMIHFILTLAVVVCCLNSMVMAQQPTQPSLILSMPQVDSLAFPSDKAGIAAYVEVSEQIDVNRLSPIFKEVRDVGDNYIIGIVTIDNIAGKIDVYLYADREGWFVSYLTKTEPTATIMQWLSISDIGNPVITNLSRTILTDALDQAKNLLLLVFPDVKYYHFKFHDANKMTLFVKTVNKSQGSDVVQFKIPQNYTLFESSFYHYAVGIGGYDSKVKIDGFLVSDLPENATSIGRIYSYDSWRNINFYQASYVTLNALHTIQVTHSSYYSTSSGLASLLIYKEGE